MFRKAFLFICLITFVIFSFNSLGFAKQGNSGNAWSNSNPGASSNGGWGNFKLDLFSVKGIKSGLIKVDKNIFYPTDTLDISVIFPKSLKAIWSGDADAYLVIRMANGTLLPPFQLLSSGQTPDQPKTFVKLDLSQNPLDSGEYQLALIMVTPGGDALNIGDWYSGFSGLISATKFQVNSQCDPIDTDCDGLVDSAGLAVTPLSITPAPGGMTTLTLGNGKPPYAIESGDESIATVSENSLQDDGTITVYGVGGGTTAITVTDNIGDSVVVGVLVTDSNSADVAVTIN